MISFIIWYLFWLMSLFSCFLMFDFISVQFRFILPEEYIYLGEHEWFSIVHSYPYAHEHIASEFVLWIDAIQVSDFFPWVSNSQAWMPITKIARKRIQCFVYEICIERKKHRMLTDTYQSMYRMASHLWFNLLLDFAGGFYFARKCMEQFPHVWFNKHVYTFRIKEAKSIRKISLANRRQ